jgi:hypothetical protein
MTVATGFDIGATTEPGKAQPQFERWRRRPAVRGSLALVTSSHRLPGERTAFRRPQEGPRCTSAPYRPGTSAGHQNRKRHGTASVSLGLKRFYARRLTTRPELAPAKCKTVGAATDVGEGRRSKRLDGGKCLNDKRKAERWRWRSLHDADVPALPRSKLRMRWSRGWGSVNARDTLAATRKHRHLRRRCVLSVTGM